VHYADGNLEEAAVQWNDCVDTIFSALYVVQQWRSHFNHPDHPNREFLADAFGYRQVLIGGIVLTKLAKLCYEGKDMHKFSECVLMASELFTAPAKLRFPHPRTAIQHSEYAFKEFFNGTTAGETYVFEDKQILQPNEVLNSVHYIAQTLIDMDKFDAAVPLCSLMEYIAGYVTKSKVLVTKARLTKAVALVETGYINEGYQLYRRIIEQKDLPKVGIKDSDVSRRSDGPNYFFDRENVIYFNELPPEHEKNMPALEFMMKTIEGKELGDLKRFCSPAILEMVQYLRTLFLVRLGEQENVQSSDKASLRDKLLSTAEEGGRGVLRNLQLIEEVTAV
jgi:hypothetical protein